METFPVHKHDSTPAHDRIREARFLITHRTLIRMALAALGAFSVTFLYEYTGESFLAPLIVSGIVALLTMIITPYAALWIGTTGIRSMLIGSVPFFALGMYGLYMVSTDLLTMPIIGIGLYIFATATYRSFYWVPYHVDFSHALSDERRGRELAGLTNLADLVVIAMPLLGGLMIVAHSYGQLFLMGILTILVSIIPLLFITERYESFSWDMRTTFSSMFLPHIRPMVLGHIGDGVQSAMLLVVWPLAVFILLKGDYEMVGAITSLTFVIVLAIRYLTGWLFDRWDKHRVVFLSALLAASGWIAKIFVWTPLQIFAANIYHEIGQVMNRTSIDAMSYEQAADNGRFVDEYTVIKEIALNAGRVLGLGIVGGVAALFGVAAGVGVGIFIAAVSAIATSWIAQRTRLVG